MSGQNSSQQQLGVSPKFQSFGNTPMGNNLTSSVAPANSAPAKASSSSQAATIAAGAVQGLAASALEALFPPAAQRDQRESIPGGNTGVIGSRPSGQNPYLGRSNFNVQTPQSLASAMLRRSGGYS